MKIRTREQTAVLRHPKDPLLEVEVRRLTGAEQLQFREDLSKLAVKKATVGPDGQVIRTQDASGNWRVDSERFVPFNVDFTLKSMRSVIKRVGGLIDEDDKAVPFDPKDPDPVLLLLFEEELNVDVTITVDEPERDEVGNPKTDPVTGKPKTVRVEKIVPQSFGWWILERVGEKETFSPLMPSSSPSSIAS